MPSSCVVNTFPTHGVINILSFPSFEEVLNFPCDLHNSVDSETKLYSYTHFSRCLFHVNAINDLESHAFVEQQHRTWARIKR